MVIKVFTGPGALQRLSGKKVMSNKSLSQRVRALSGLEGTRKQVNQDLYNEVATAADVADINYMGIMNALNNVSFHRLRFWLELTVAADSSNRIIVFEDRQASAAEAAVGDILVSGKTHSPYATASHPFSAKSNNKNLDGMPRIRILKDIYFSGVLSQITEKVVKIFDVPLHNKKGTDLTDYGVLIITSAVTTVDLEYLLDFTDNAD